MQVHNRHFETLIDGKYVSVRKVTNAAILNCSVFMDNQYIGNSFGLDSFTINRENFRNAKQLQLQADVNINGKFIRSVETFPLHSMNMQNLNDRERTFKAGDILVACDNVSGDLPQGYMGHSAVVIDSEHIIEAAGRPPVQKATVQSFLKKHPIHAHFRPKSHEMGEKAAAYAENYLETYEKEDKGLVFNFSVNTPLKEEWTNIYCSKLVWLSYYYGADYKFENDFLWFAPEDLYAILNESPDFEKLYEHPDFAFLIDV